MVIRMYSKVTFLTFEFSEVDRVTCPTILARSNIRTKDATN